MRVAVTPHPLFGWPSVAITGLGAVGAHTFGAAVLLLVTTAAAIGAVGVSSCIQIGAVGAPIAGCSEGAGEPLEGIRLAITSG